ncbi:calbindin-32 isoform X2 [Dermacentor albipictus]|uniref:calbindin-32 isoform X2 n=2 Tax=Dermacentor albipictus TaxID=60249 RepID=UPI0038FC29BD
MPRCDALPAPPVRPSGGRAPAAWTRGGSRSILRLRRGEDAPPGGAPSGRRCWDAVGRFSSSPAEHEPPLRRAAALRPEHTTHSQQRAPLRDNPPPPLGPVDRPAQTTLKRLPNLPLPASPTLVPCSYRPLLCQKLNTSAMAESTKAGSKSSANFMRQFRDKKTRELKNLTASQFMDVWSHYDKDGNGFIEGRELDNFLREFVSSVSLSDVGPEVVSESMLEELKECFMEAYDDNKDGKIEIRELAQLLPLEESFLLLFRFDNPLESSVEFMKIWREYDTDGSGYIEADELKNFLKDLLREAKKDSIEEDKLIEYTDTLLQIFDSNKDGKLQLSEMAKLLPVKENFLCRSAFKLTDATAGASKLTREDIERVFALYDRDKNGTIENEELKGFLKDLLELVKKDYDAQDLEEFQEAILRGCDFNKDGKISKKELTMVLLALAKHSADEDGK